MAGQQYDPEVISFLKLRNAPLTHANYNSVLQQMQSNPSMRGAPVADPSQSDKTYDGGLDELNMGGDVPAAGPRPGASAPPVPQGKPAIPENQMAHGASGSWGNEAGPASAGASGAGPAAAATAVGGGTLAGLVAYLRGQSNGAGGAPPRVEPSGPAIGDPTVRAGLPATAVPVPDGGSGASMGAQDLLEGHAPPAALPAPADTGQLLLPDHGAGDPMVNPGAAPHSPVVPMPDNAPNGMIEQLADQINKLGKAGRSSEAAQLIERLIGLVGHAHR